MILNFESGVKCIDNSWTVIVLLYYNYGKITAASKTNCANSVSSSNLKTTLWCAETDSECC